MNLHPHPYGSPADLYRIGATLRRAHAAAPALNAWTFARYDIWAQRRIADTQIHGRSEWQADIAIWDASGSLPAGAVFFEGRQQAVMIQHPGFPELAGEMVAWAEAQHARKQVHDPLRLEVRQGNLALERLLEGRGYSRPSSFFIHRVKRLDGPHELVITPPGFRIKTCETPAEAEGYRRAVRAVFNWLDTPEVYRVVQQAPSFTPELELVALSSQGEVAAFTTAWVNCEDRTAEFEPVGTLAEYRQRGLGAALLAEANNRLRRLGIRAVTVDSWSESPAANRLYESAGLCAADRIYNWKKG